MWRKYPKWAICAAREDYYDAPRTPFADNVSIAGHSSTTSSGLEARKSDEYDVLRASTARGGGTRPIETLNAILLKPEEVKTQALRSMAGYVKRNYNALENRNAIAAFSRSGHSVHQRRISSLQRSVKHTTLNS